MTNSRNSKGNGQPDQHGDAGIGAGENAVTGESPEAEQEETSRFYPMTVASRAARRRALLNSVFTKAADISGRMALSSVLKIAGVSLAVGAGASALGAAAAGVVLAGAGSAVYTYGRETYTEYRARKQQGENVTFLNVLRQNNQQRMRRTLTSLATGVAFGVLGGWLAQSDALQWTVEKAGPVVKGWLSAAAGFFGLGGAPDVDVTAAAPAAPVVPVVPAVEDAVVAAPEAPVVEAATAVAPAAVDVAADPLAAGLAQTQLGDLDSVAAWQLKDAAHDILRMDTIDAADRIAMARALAQEAAERGNAQAVSFLTDLPKVEAAWGLPVSDVPVVDAPVAAAPVAEAVAPVEAPVDAPVAAAPVDTAVAETTVEPAVEQTTVLPDITLGGAEDVAAAPVGDVEVAPVVTAAPAVVQDLPALAPRFAVEAALCNVTIEGGEPVDITCVVKNPVMDPTDYISFVDATNTAVRVTTTLDAGSVSMATHSMLQETTISDGASRLRTLVRVTLGLNR